MKLKKYWNLLLQRKLTATCERPRLHQSKKKKRNDGNLFWSKNKQKDDEEEAEAEADSQNYKCDIHLHKTFPHFPQNFSEKKKEIRGL